jgi:hypothetical protein
VAKLTFFVLRVHYIDIVSEIASLPWNHYTSEMFNTVVQEAFDKSAFFFLLITAVILKCLTILHATIFKNLF